METTRKVCRGKRGHDDAIALVEYLMNRGGKVEKTNEAIAMDLAMMVNRGGGNWQVDVSRFMQARRHVQDNVGEGGGPCTGYRLNYRASGGKSQLVLTDPVGDIGHHATAAVEAIRGWMSRESQHHTENLRQIAEIEALGDHALAQGDRNGYKLCARMSVELERDGTVLPQTMAEVGVWLESL